ncbi:hypothetical protein SBBP2_650005 [Burkholderiales bacterium]|nr:hypothetical protein SBBP2_650005 [Burkholderiales bacterium]
MRQKDVAYSRRSRALTGCRADCRRYRGRLRETLEPLAAEIPACDPRRRSAQQYACEGKCSVRHRSDQDREWESRSKD